MALPEFANDRSGLSPPLLSPSFGELSLRASEQFWIFDLPV